MKISRSLQIIILLIVVLVLTSIIWPKNPVNAKIKKMGNFLINPLKNFSGQIAYKTENFWLTLKDIRKLTQVNRELEKENLKLIEENSHLKEVENENKILRSQLIFTQEKPEYKLVPAEVIGRDPSNFLQFMTINKGTNDGLKKDMPVVSEGYLLGKITEVDAKNAKVFLITNPSSVVNAMIQESRATGIVKGALGYALTIEAISQDAKVKVGNLVITSGLGGTYPKGLIIGKIDQVEEKQSEIFKKATIKPFIDYTFLEVVFVIAN
jgi:rod shape-determining protein MreC